MNKDEFSSNDLIAIMMQLWCKNYYEYRDNDRSRVQLSFALLLYCYTSSRIDEMHEFIARKQSAKSQEIAIKTKTTRVQVVCYKVSER